jgi:NADPH:quinone reductase-like Zn-dependent oxidoreductase
MKILNPVFRSTAPQSRQAIFDTANLQAGERILITGASGGVGSMAAQLAKAKGAFG